MISTLLLIIIPQFRFTMQHRSPVHSSPVRALTGTVILYESYLYKTPPLDKLFVSWKKRWFVLTRTTDAYDHSTVELAYFADSDSKEKKGTISLSKVETVNPTPLKSKDNIFSLEMSDHHKQMFKSPDAATKAMWIAKLLEVCSKDGQTLHVTVPTQQTSAHTEGVLNLSTPLKVKVVNPLSKETILDIPFEKIRRFGCQVSYQSDIVWFEICNCKMVRGLPPQFVFFIVNSGIERAYKVVQELKRNIEYAIRAFLIMVDSDKEALKYSYVVRTHYGCPELTDVSKEQALQAGLVSASADYAGAIQLSQMNRLRRTSEFGVSKLPVPGVTAEVDRRHTIADLGKVNNARTPSPQTSPNLSGRRTLQDMAQRPTQRPMGLSASAGRNQFDSGIPSNSFDPSRGSAPCDLDMTRPNQKPPASKEEIMKKVVHKNKSFDDGIGDRKQDGRKILLAQVQHLGGHTGLDSEIGSAKDIPGSYDHLSLPRNRHAYVES